MNQELINILRRFADQRIVIIGDAIADRFVHGSISRVSREAPVFILQHQQTETLPGGAANCAMNLLALGAKVSLISVPGRDEAGNELRAKLETAGVNIDGVIVSDKIQTTTKVRILAGHSHGTKQQVIRIDYEGTSLTDEEVRSVVLNKLQHAIATANAVVISDYNYGVVDARAVDLIRKEAAVPVLVDSRFRLLEYPEFTAATPNQEEVENLSGAPIASAEQLERAATMLKQRLGHRALLVTRGGEGMTLVESDASPVHIRAVGAEQPVDVTGAGDTVIATFTLALASGASFVDAARLANYAGGLVVMKRGTATVESEELRQAVISDHAVDAGSAR